MSTLFAIFCGAMTQYVLKFNKFLLHTYMAKCTKFCLLGESQNKDKPQIWVYRETRWVVGQFCKELTK